MRFMAQYTVVRDELATGKFGPLASMTVTAGCFGLAMNGSHYCEAFAWLTGSPIVNGDRVVLRERLQQSSRAAVFRPGW